MNIRDKIIQAIEFEVYIKLLTFRAVTDNNVVGRKVKVADQWYFDKMHVETRFIASQLRDNICHLETK